MHLIAKGLFHFFQVSPADQSRAASPILQTQPPQREHSFAFNTVALKALLITCFTWAFSLQMPITQQTTHSLGVFQLQAGNGHLSKNRKTCQI